MEIVRRLVNRDKFNRACVLPFNLRPEDFSMAMQDVYDFFWDVNKLLIHKGLERLDDTLRPANLSGMISDMLTVSLAKHSRSLTINQHFNGHPDLVVKGVYANNAVKAGDDGVEIKSTGKRGGAVDFHGARNQWLCTFVYSVDRQTEPAKDRESMMFTELYVAGVTVEDFRKNARKSDLSTKTATIDRDGLAKMRQSWLYLDVPPKLPRKPTPKATSR